MSEVIRISNVENAAISNLTITNGHANCGSGFYCYCSSPILVNCILWNNSPQEVEFVSFDDPNTITIAYSDIDGGEAGIETNNNGTVYWLEGNIDADPLFVDALVGDYHLTEDSPCIDTGIAYFEYEGEVLVDLSEDEYFGIAPDMGVYEYGLVNTDELKIENVKCKINAYPNPFNPETNIVFDISTESNVLIEIYNIKGQKVTTLVNGPFEAGSHKVTWNAVGQSSGIYLLRFISAETSETKKLILLK
ncbi:MAG: T9SS type A sorting domain-containing protein [Candidatus Stygibacter australis]|nr:T9SS type A sorting domain-containing protein [Candidatus Stygibacter australis]MDP8321811.1 T9SS type A sorting domain-containing protein [Candidatus Stygibacter australis]